MGKGLILKMSANFKEAVMKYTWLKYFSHHMNMQLFKCIV